MRLKLILPQVVPTELEPPLLCPYEGCGRTSRVYPKGVTKAQMSLRVKGLGVLLYLLGLSYGAVSLALDALGVYMCKSRVYDAVRAAAQRVPGLKPEQPTICRKAPSRWSAVCLRHHPPESNEAMMRDTMNSLLCWHDIIGPTHWQPRVAAARPGSSRAWPGVPGAR